MGVDVGAGSVRAGLFDDGGRMLAAAKTVISLRRAAGLMVERSSAAIWAAVCSSVRTAGEDEVHAGCPRRARTPDKEVGNR
jgi:D-ribulokinase